MKLIKNGILALAVGAFAAYLANIGVGRSIKHPTTTKELSQTSVMITNLKRNSGGTGVVLSSTAYQSKILTNMHVCGVVENGGIIESEHAIGVVATYQVSQIHDICLITTNTDFKVNTELSARAPELFSKAAIVGHPALNPTTITEGHFSHKRVVQVLYGFKPCSKEDWESENGIYCMFMGGIPLIRTLEAQLVSALIMPGSSGSAVYNDSGEISGLVFAGSGDLGFALIVPQEYVKNFLENELKDLAVIKPTSDNANASSQSKMFDKLRTACKATPENQGLSKYCKFVNKDLLYIGDE